MSDCDVSAMEEWMAQPDMRTCACVSFDAQRCYEVRYNVESEDNDERESCECSCHDDEDDD